MKRFRLGAAALTALLSLSACSLFTRQAHALAPALGNSCRQLDSSTRVTWVTPDDPGDRARLDGVCAGVGPVLFRSSDAASAAPRTDLSDIAFVSWNLHVGAADAERFVRDLRAGRLTNGRKPAQIVMMLQEAVRAEGVPAHLADGALCARRIGTAGSGADHRAIESVARDLGLSVFYVPSMRNGADGSDSCAATDRGNAILSTLPLSAPTAIELPGDRQRRVAVTASIPVSIGGHDVDLGIGAAHLDTMGRKRTLWLFGASSLRGEQAHSLIHALPAGAPMIVGADLNSWLGTSEEAPVVLSRAFPDTPSTAREGTFLGGLVLDYMFFRSPAGWRASFDRVPDKYGSDHCPLVGRLES